MARRTARSSSKGPSRPLDATCRIVILHGKERFLQDVYLGKLREALAAAHGDDGLDTLHFDGATSSAADILDECRSFGLMSQHKLVIVDNADELLKADPDDAPKPARGHLTARQAMEHYADAPSDGATLVLRAGTWRAGKLDKAVMKIGSVAKCDQPTPAEAIGWAKRRCEKRYDTKIAHDAAALLVEHLGGDLGRIDSELAKLSTMAPGEPITAERVRQIVGFSREEDFWMIQQTLISGDPALALAQLRDMIEVSRQSPVALSWAYTDLARKLHGLSRGLSQGKNPGSLAKALRIWGPSGDALFRVARRVDPEAACALFQAAVDADVRAKSGVGDPRRGLEALTVQFASLCA